jgi:hypothetical protein
VCHQVASFHWSSDSCVHHFLQFISHLHYLDFARADAATRQQVRNCAAQVIYGKVKVPRYKPKRLRGVSGG